MQYLNDENIARECADKFAAAFNGIKSAEITKSQKNSFGLYVKYPLIIFIFITIIAAVFIVQSVLSIYDVFYTVAEVIITLGLTGYSVILVLTWARVIKNAKITERITYYNGNVKIMVTEISGSGQKVEWSDASLYINGDDFELIESKTKAYSPYFFKKLHGHSRGYKLFNTDALLHNFFYGATLIKNEQEGEIQSFEMSSGFRYTLNSGRLISFEIDGFYDECFQNNFPLWAFKPQSKSYTFRYEFSEVNSPSFRLILPERTKEAAKLYFVKLPEDVN